MTIYWKILAGSLISVLLCPLIAKNHRELSLPLALLTAVLAAMAGLEFIRPVVDFLHRLGESSPLTGRYLPLLLKVAGIGITAEIAGEACKEAGNLTLAKILPLLGGALILGQSLIVYSDLRKLLEEVLMGF